MCPSDSQTYPSPRLSKLLATGFTAFYRSRPETAWHALSSDGSVLPHAQVPACSPPPQSRRGISSVSPDSPLTISFNSPQNKMFIINIHSNGKNPFEILTFLHQVKNRDDDDDDDAYRRLIRGCLVINKNCDV